jgi:hypothetical protein
MLVLRRLLLLPARRWSSFSIFSATFLFSLFVFSRFRRSAGEEKARKRPEGDEQVSMKKVHTVAGEALQMKRGPLWQSE